jgi:hypothetical protein
MKKILFFVLIAIALQTNAQTNTDYLKEINRDIWLPFIEAYGNANVTLYKSLHSTDFIRATGSEKTLPSYDMYFKNTGNWFDNTKKEGTKLEIAFRFSERFANGIVASERGIYQLKSFDKTGKIFWTGYGKFHVFMRKINYAWKIVVDYDSNEKNTIDEKSYLAAFALDDYEKY